MQRQESLADRDELRIELELIERYSMPALLATGAL